MDCSKWRHPDRPLPEYNDRMTVQEAVKAFLTVFTAYVCICIFFTWLGGL